MLARPTDQLPDDAAEPHAPWHWFETSGHNRLDHPAVRGLVFNSRHACKQHRLQDELARRATFEDAISGIVIRFARSAEDRHEGSPSAAFVRR